MSTLMVQGTILLKIFTDNEYYFTKSTTNGVVNRIVHDSFAVGTQSVQLFQAPVTAAHAGSKHK